MKHMLLQYAIILGDTLKKCDPWTWMSFDGSCGCAFGGALLAAGVTPAEFHKQFMQSVSEHATELPLVRQRWPWLAPEHLLEISSLYFEVADGLKNIEDVAAYVRTVEPDPFNLPDLPLSEQLRLEEEAAAEEGAAIEASGYQFPEFESNGRY